MNKAPLFIGGYNWSGTTMPCSMLGFAKERIAMPESHFKVDPMKKIAPNSNGFYVSGKGLNAERSNAWKNSL